jgi:hypothetical protein
MITACFRVWITVMADAEEVGAREGEVAES